VGVGGSQRVQELFEREHILPAHDDLGPERSVAVDRRAGLRCTLRHLLNITLAPNQWGAGLTIAHVCVIDGCQFHVGLSKNGGQSD
jgi:hypothetical protein